MSRWIVSVDLGQTKDPTAISVLEVSTRQDALDAQYTVPPGELASAVTLDWFNKNGSTGYLLHPRRALRVDVRHLERLKLGMDYVDQVAHVAALLRRPPLGHASLVLDMTGVGRPVANIARRAGLRPVCVTITAGDKESRDYVGGYEEWKVAKLLLVSHLQACLNEGTLRINKNLPEARTLTEEMMDFRANISEAGYTRFGAREGAHDDLVLAVAIGNWWACREHGWVETGHFSLSHSGIIITPASAGPCSCFNCRHQNGAQCSQMAGSS